MDITPEILAILVMAATLAGIIDSIAGGGGLIALPALLWAGVPPVEALATNKLQGSFGTATATFNYMRQNALAPGELVTAVIWTFCGSVCGTLAVQYLISEWLNQLAPVLLIGFACYFVFSPQLGDKDAKQRIRYPQFALLAGFSLGFYDGFFGPGAGTFMTAAFVLLLGYNLYRATAATKLLNLTSNLASLLFFALGGQVLWVVGLCMGLGQIVGAWIGSHLVLKHGASLIRPLLFFVSIAISIKLLLS